MTFPQVSRRLVFALALALAPFIGDLSARADHDCTNGLELARAGQYEEAFGAWKESLARDIEYKQWAQVGLRCLISSGEVRSDSELVAWYRNAHESGSINGTVQYALILMLGLNGSPNFEHSVALLLQASQRGHDHAAELMGVIEKYCPDVRQCENEAAKGPEAARENGHFRYRD